MLMPLREWDHRFQSRSRMDLHPPTNHSHTSTVASRRQAHVAYAQNMRHAHPHELAWFLRWALGRVVRLQRTEAYAADTVQGARPEVDHARAKGLLEWDDYEQWRGRERGMSRCGLAIHSEGEAYHSS